MVEVLLNDQMYNVTYIAQCNTLWHFKYSKRVIYDINLQNWVLLGAKIPFAAAIFWLSTMHGQQHHTKGKDISFRPFRSEKMLSYVYT
jgi:hypothetical protein